MPKNNRTFSSGITAVILGLTVIASPVANAAMKKTDLSFAAAFPKPFYEKSYFPFVVMGTTVVAAGVITYATGGGGAPAAATGVSTVASWVGGGGAGSYMAGLSTIGGWVGGNAMTGAAILNGVSIGLGGGSAAFTRMNTLGQASVLTGMSASMMDGILFFTKDGKNLIVDVRLEVPRALASGTVAKLAEDFNENTKEMADAVEKNDHIKQKRLTSEREEISNRVEFSAKRMANQKAIDIGNAVVLSTMAKNIGLHDLGDRLLFKIPNNYLSQRGYYYYLLGVTALQNGKTEAAKNYLSKSMDSEKYAIEPVILYTNLVSHINFKKNQPSIKKIGEDFDKKYERDNYKTGYGLAALYYRLGSAHLSNGYYKSAEFWFRKSEDELSWYQLYFGNNQIRNLVRFGTASALCGQGRRKESNLLMIKIKEDGGTPLNKKSNITCAR